MDINHTWSGDISLNSYNDMNVVDGLDETNQRVLRRLLTNPGEYIWHPEYGAGLGRFVGVALNDEISYDIKQLITSQMYLESDVSKTPPPDITLQVDQNELICTIIYYNLSQSQLTLSFSLKP